MDANWFEKFFEGLARDLWSATNTPEHTAEEAEFLIEKMGLKPGMAALDVPCGNGRLAIELARRGIQMTGVDLSAGYIHEAQRTDAGVELVLGDMRALPWRSRFDAAFCWGNSFGYFDHGNCVRFLEGVARTLKPDGRFMMETGLVAESLLPHLEPGRTLQIGEISFESRNVYDPVEGRLDITYTFTRGEQREVKATQQWVHSAAEIRRMLRQSGLEPVEAFGDVDGSGYALAGPRLILLARRAAGCEP